MAGAQITARKAGRRGDVATLALLCVAQFVDVLGVTVVVVALPSIAADLDLDGSVRDWVVSGYALAFGGLLLLAGRAADLYGPRRLFIAGLTVLGAASLACGVASSPPVLLSARVVQGAAAAMVVPAALAMLTATFPDGPLRIRALGAWTAAAAGGGAAGFLLGGLLAAALGWRSVFVMVVPVALAAAALAPSVLPGGRTVNSARLDVLGALLVTGGIGATIAGVTLGAERGLTSILVLQLLGAGGAMLAGFVLVEHRRTAPLVPLAMLRRPETAGSAGAAFALTATTSSAAILITAYLQDVLGRSPAATGLVFLPFSVSVVAGAFLGPRVVARLGGRRTVAIGLTGISVAMIVLTRLDEAGQLAPLLVGLVLSGAALGVGSVAATAIGTASAQASEEGVIAGVLNTATQLGTGAGVAILGGLATARSRSLADGGVPDMQALIEGFQTGWLAAATVATLAITVTLWPRRPTRQAAVHG